MQLLHSVADLNIIFTFLLAARLWYRESARRRGLGRKFKNVILRRIKAAKDDGWKQCIESSVARTHLGVILVERKRTSTISIEFSGASMYA